MHALNHTADGRKAIRCPKVASMNLSNCNSSLGKEVQFGIQMRQGLDGVGRWAENFHVVDALHCNHGLESRLQPVHVEPPEGGTPNQPRFMESPHNFDAVHWDHEPADRAPASWSAAALCRQDAGSTLGFMDSSSNGL